MYLLSPLAAAAGIALSVFLFFTFRRNELNVTINRLENNCDVKQVEVQRQLAGGITLMYAMQSITYALGADRMTNDIWATEAGRLIMAGNWSVLSLSRAELVSLKDLSRWEASTGLRVVETAPNLDLVPVPRDRPFYLPIIDTYPASARVRGLDNLSETARRDVALRAYQRHDLVMSDPFFAPNANPAGGGRQRAFLLYLPLYDATGFPSGAITEAYFENTIVRDRFSGGITYGFGIGQMSLFSDRTSESSAIIRDRVFPIADRTITLRCGTFFEQSLAPTLVAALGIILSLSVAGTLLVVTWISRKRRASDLEAQRLESERTVAEDLYRLKNTFLNHVSHELKTPLNGVQGVLTGLLDDGLNQEQRQVVGEAAQRADELGEMLDNLVEYSAFEAGSVQLWRETVPLRTVVSEVVDRAQRMIRNGNQFRAPDYVPPVLIHTDRRKVTKALRILLHNAFRYTEGGIVGLTCVREGDSVYLTVSDTGHGMSAPLLQAVRQGEVARAKESNGLGLGLSLLNRIAAAINAEVTINSVEGTGSTFIITLKVSGDDRTFDIPASEAAGEVPGSHSEASTDIPTPETSLHRDAARADNQSVESIEMQDLHAKKVVLVADDNDLNRKVLCKMLRRLGYECIEANDGLEALEVYRQHGDEVGLVLMDIQMPHMDGVQATQELKAKNAGIPVVAVTANAVNSELQRYMESGMSEVLSKPVNREQLDRVLKMYAQTS